MKFLFVSTLLLVTGSVYAACPANFALAKAARAAVAVEQLNRGTRVGVVTQAVRGESPTEFMITVQVRGTELGGNVWDVMVNKLTCNVEELKFGMDLE